MQYPETENAILIDASCRELHGSWSGRLVYDSGAISARLMRYHHETQSREFSSNRVPFVLETAQVATLLGCYQASLGGIANAARGFHVAELRASNLLVGLREWLSTDRVSMIEFCLPEALGSLSYDENYEFDFEDEGENLTYIRRIREAKAEIMRLRCDGFELVMSKRPSIPSSRKEDLGRDPTWLTVAYDDPPIFEKAFHVPLQLQAFFEMSEGKPLRPKGLAIKAYPPTSQDRFAESGLDSSGIDDFVVYQGWNAHEYQYAGNVGSDSIFRVYTPEDREVTTTALNRWFERRTKWEVTYWLISESVHLGKLMDRRRLLNAFACFESIPDFQKDSGIDKYALQRFRRECRGLESYRSLGITKKRLTDVLNELKRLALHERIQMAIREIRATFGSEILDHMIESDCESAIRFRNQAAHGSPDESTYDFKEYVIAMSAIETVVLLAIIRDLNISSDRIRNLTNPFFPHPLARHNMRSLNRRSEPQHKQ